MRPAASVFFRRFGQSTLSLKIAIKELILAVIAAKLWGYGRCLLFRNGLMQKRHLALILCEPTIFAITNSFTFTATRIEGVTNRRANALSRFELKEFFGE